MTSSSKPEATASGAPRAQVLFILGVQGAVRLRNFVLIPLFFRGFGAESYGQWILVLTIGTLATLCCGGNLQSGVLRRFGSADPRVAGQLYWTAVAFACTAGLTLALGLLLFCASAAGVLAPESLALVRALAPITLAAVIRSAGGGGFRAVGAYRKYSVISALPHFVEVLAISGALYLGQDIVTALWLLALGEGVIGILALGFVTRIIPPTLPRWEALRGLAAFSFPTLVTTLSERTMRDADRVIIGFLLGVQAVGIYSAAYVLASIPLFLMQPVRVVLLRSLSPIWDRDERARVETILQLALKAILFLTLPISVGAALVGPDALALLTGEVDARWTALLILTVGLGNVCFALLILANHGLMLLDRNRVGARGVATCAALNVIATFALVPLLGLSGAALATLLAYAGAASWCFFAARPELRARISIEAIGKIALGLVLMSLVVAPLVAPDVSWLTGAISAGAVVYVAAAWWLGFFDNAESRQLFGRGRT